MLKKITEKRLNIWCEGKLYDSEFPIIYINNSMPKTRQIFTLFHELSHLLFKTGGIDKIRDTYVNSLSGDDRRIEIFCDKFAGDFLVPENDFNQQVKRCAGTPNRSRAAGHDVPSLYNSVFI